MNFTTALAPLILAIVAVFALIFVSVFLYFVNVWIRALAARAPVSIV